MYLNDQIYISYNSQYCKCEMSSVLVSDNEVRKPNGDKSPSDLWPCRFLKYIECFELDLSCL